ncbi:MAG TPA: thiamine ABC transporter substrate-binding protein, partial [Candidatus Thermoplasmatota archaeon]|nr:thiamine ABC transporter substrate-binding protein [Candidatus Thermoplasmatota archaeon]
RALLLAALLAAPLLAGCTLSERPATEPGPSYAEQGFNGTNWPDLHGATVRVLAYKSFSSVFDDHRKQFENLTNGTLVLVTAEDSGKALERAIRERGNPSFDVVYGVDNVLLGKARRGGAFEAYQPVLAERIAPEYRFVEDWIATPVTHGYIAVNVDPLRSTSLASLEELKQHAGLFVTEDPRLSTPGLGFLIATVATYGEASPDRYDYLDYWTDLLRGGALVVPDWTVAYENHFSGGYGASYGRADKAIVTSYTTSPAYELYYNPDGMLNQVLTAPNATFHQIQTVGIAKGTPNRAAAEAFIEYALTDQAQALAAPGEAIYPVVRNVSTDAVYGENDPEPGTFSPAPFTAAELDAGVERWVREWTDLYERLRAEA